MNSSPSVSLRSIAIPAEHGGWGFLFEPILLGLLVAPSLPGLYVSIGIVGLFLMRQPLKIVLVDWRRDRRFARTRLAERVALAYGLVALLGLGAAVLTSSAFSLLPLVLASPFITIQLYYDFSNQGRAVLPELAGPTALASVASAIALAGGWPLPSALALWAIMSARAVPSVLYVRARLRLEKEQPVSAKPALAAHIVALVGVGILAGIELVPWLTLIPLAGLLGRAVLGLSPRRKPTSAKIIGFRELAYGLLTVMFMAATFRFGA